MKNKRSVIFGTSIGIFLILAGIELIQLLVAYFAGAEQVNAVFESVYYRAEFIFTGNPGKFATGITYLAPFIASVMFIEILIRIVSISKPGEVRYTSLLIELYLIGFMLLKVFYSVFLLFLAPDYGTDWNNFLRFADMGDTLPYVVTMLFIIMIVAYLGNSTARIKKYIDIH